MGEILQPDSETVILLAIEAHQDKDENLTKYFLIKYNK